MAIALIADTETTSAKQPLEVIQLAYLRVSIDGNPIRFVEEFWFKPTLPISNGAKAKCHILESELVNCPPTSTCSIPDCDYLIGHHIDFDWDALGRPPVKLICTHFMSRELFLGQDSYSLGGLMYMLRGDEAKRLVKNAHGASVDVHMCSILLRAIIALKKFETFEDMYLFSEACRVPTIMPFGKHRDTPIVDVPSDYKRWLLRQPDVDKYLRIALERTLT